MHRSLVAIAPSPSGEPRVVNRRTGDIDAETAAAAFVTAITVGKSPASGWDPQEVWLDRVHRPRLRRRCD